MTIYPAIDLKGGRCVRLAQGRADQETVYPEDPAEVAAGFKAAGSEWVHVVDLDGAFTGQAQNMSAVQAIASAGLRVEFGGGLRSRESVERALAMGVSRAVIGTRAAESDEFIGELVREFADRIAVGIDARNGRVAIKGWVDTTGTSALALAGRMAELGVATLIHTDISADGMLTGPNFAAQEALLSAVGCRVIASGGVGQREDVSRFAALALRHANLDGVIVGKALYEKRVDLADLLKLAAEYSA